MTTIMEITESDYHADQVADQPTLSASVARILIDQSPAHARAAHPKLTTAPVVKEGGPLDLGTAAHALLLQGDDAVVQVDADDWRTKTARDQRDAVRAMGLVPLLAKDWQRVQDMVAAVRDQLDGFDAVPPLLTEGTAERTIVWEEHGVLCRSRLDWLRDDHFAVDDLKTTGRSASPEQWSRTLFTSGYDVQAAFYRRAVRSVSGKVPLFRFLVVETTPPYALTVLALAPEALELADAKVEFAIRTWRECLASGRWPGYPRQVCWAHPPGWMEAQWFDREARDAA